jgi:3-hydroxy-9,10-secoandrosta-1,3,5(10)-triene-9,17-dione monooxygenase reductase component
VSAVRGGPRSQHFDAHAEGALDGERFRAVMSDLPTGVTVVTATADDGPVGCTVNAILSVSLAPPTLLVSLATGSGTLATLLERGSFGVSILSWEQRGLSQQFATGTAAMRFAQVAYSTPLDVPVLDGAAAAMVCRVRRTVEVADHLLVIGEPLWCTQDGSRGPVVLVRRALLRGA